MTPRTTTISRFRYEDMCSKGFNVLPISSVCNGACLFCSNKMNPFYIHKCGFRPMREVYEFLQSNAQYINPTAEIRLSDVLPGRLSEGEATLHPFFFNICKAVRDRLPNNPLHITTNGSKLTEEFIDKMSEFLPFHVMVSYHSHNIDHWTNIFKLEEKDFNIATNSFVKMREAGIHVESTVVALPNLVGYNDIEQTLKFLDNNSDYIQIWKPGYSKLADDSLVEMLYVDDDEFVAFLRRMYKANKTFTHSDADPSIPLKLDVHSIMHDTLAYKNVSWLTSSLCYDRLCKLVEDCSILFSNNHKVVEVENITYGGNVSCTGLLMVSDLQRAISNSPPADLYIIPNTMLDRGGRDLTEVHCSTLNTYNNPIWWREQ